MPTPESPTITSLKAPDRSEEDLNRRIHVLNLDTDKSGLRNYKRVAQKSVFLLLCTSACPCLENYHNL